MSLLLFIGFMLYYIRHRYLQLEIYKSAKYMTVMVVTDWKTKAPFTRYNLLSNRVVVKPVVKPLTTGLTTGCIV